MESENLTESMIVTRSQNACLESIRRVNLWGLNIRDASLLGNMPMLEVISLSSNKIESLKPFSNCIHLKEIYLRNNNIKELDEIKHLSKLSYLHTLFLLGNPCCYSADAQEINSSTQPHEFYRSTVIKHISSLVRLDLHYVTVEEMKAARIPTRSSSPDDSSKSVLMPDSSVDEPYEKFDNSDLSSTIKLNTEHFSNEAKCPNLQFSNIDNCPITIPGLQRQVENDTTQIINEEAVDSARKRIPYLPFSTKQTLMEILQLLPKLNRDSLVLLSNEINTRLTFMCGGQ